MNYVLTFSSNVRNIYKQNIHPKLKKTELIDQAFCSNGIYYKNEEGGYSVDTDYSRYKPQRASFMISPDFGQREVNYNKAFDENKDAYVSCNPSSSSSSGFFTHQPTVNPMSYRETRPSI